MPKKGLLLVLATALISGISIFINKFGVAVITPYIFSGLKNIVVVVLVSSWLFMMKDWSTFKKLEKKQWIWLVGIGLLGGSIPFLLFFKGLSMTSGAQAAFIHKTMFLWAAIMALFFLKEKINKNFIITALLLIIGNTMLLGLLPTKFNIGDLMILAATFLWAAEAVLSKKALLKLPVRIVIWGRMFFGAIFIFMFWIFSGQLAMVSSISTMQLGWVLITAVFLLGYVVTWYSGLKYLKVSVATSVLVLGGPITAILALGFSSQALSVIQALGIALILIAFGILVKSKKVYQYFLNNSSLTKKRSLRCQD